MPDDTERVQPSMPSQLDLARKDVHDGATRTHEPGLRDLAESFAAAECPGTVRRASAVAYLSEKILISPDTYMHLLRAALLTWSPSAESLPERLRLTDWLQQLFSIPEAQHMAALEAALHANRTAVLSFQKRADAAQAAQNALGQPSSMLPEASDFLAPETRLQWLQEECMRCAAAASALRAQPRFAAVLRVTLHSVRGLMGGSVKRGLARLACCGAPTDAGLKALYCKLWLHGNGDAQCAAEFSFHASSCSPDLALFKRGLTIKCCRCICLLRTCACGW